MENAIYYRRSCRSYSSEPLTRTELAEIEDFSKLWFRWTTRSGPPCRSCPATLFGSIFPGKHPN